MLTVWAAVISDAGAARSAGHARPLNAGLSWWQDGTTLPRGRPPAARNPPDGSAGAPVAAPADDQEAMESRPEHPDRDPGDRHDREQVIRHDLEGVGDGQPQEAEPDDEEGDGRLRVPVVPEPLVPERRGGAESVEAVRRDAPEEQRSRQYDQNDAAGAEDQIEDHGSHGASFRPTVTAARRRAP